MAALCQWRAAHIKAAGPDEAFRRHSALSVDVVRGNPAASMKLSLIMPARQEAQNIGPTLEALRGTLAGRGIPYEALVVVDAQDEETARAVLTRQQQDGAVELVINRSLPGFGRAIACGLEVYRGDAAVIVMADGSDHPGDVVRYYECLRDRAECAFGSRFMPGGRVVDYPPHKLALNRAANQFIKQLFRLSYDDVTNAFKGYRRAVIQACQPIFSPHFNITVELPLKAIVRGFTFEVMPIQWTNRKFGVSKLKIEEMGSRYLYTTLNIWLERTLTGEDFRRRDLPPSFERAPREGARRKKRA